ncbi:MAG: DNA-binding FadR family transcriptional regulator [Granulosicoccus sp.]|jgi:DNA-binding FadR family transcriptional regulator
MRSISSQTILSAASSWGELPNNTPLPAEKDLGCEYGASRTVVREAITTLTNRGIPERNATNYVSHKAIYEAILERDADAAELHLENAREQFKDIFEVANNN